MRFLEVIRFLEAESGTVVLGIEEWGIRVRGYRALVWEDENIMEMDGGDDCTTL